MIEQTDSGWRVITETPIMILLLKSQTEYYNYVSLQIGFADCGCEEVKIFETEEAVLEYISVNDLTKYIPELEVL